MRHSLKSKMTAIVLLVAAALSATAVLVGYKVYSRVMDSYYTNHAMNLAGTVAATVDKTDMRRYADQVLRIYGGSGLRDEETEEGRQKYFALFDGVEDGNYRRELKQLRDIKRVNDILYLYIITTDPATRAGIYVMDSDESDGVCPIGTWEVLYDENQAVFEDPLRGFPAYISNTGDFGWLCSAGAPIVDQDGGVIGYVMVDISMEEVMNDRHAFLFKFCAALAMTTLAMVALMVYFVNRKIVSPINQLAAAAASYISDKKRMDVGGEKESSIQKLAIRTGDEIENLSEAVKKMEKDLYAYVDDLTRMTAEKERISAELDVATQIQADMLPRIFPPFPDRTEFDIYATMNPAKEVGGDFYDFFLVDEDHLAVVIADVSGKGVPAALFMVIAKTLINNHARGGESLEQVFMNTNDQLCESNQEGMFVTACMGLLTLSTGKLEFVNAGHNPPLLKKAKGGFTYLKLKSGFVLAGMEHMKYRKCELSMEPGDVLYLYTDGVTEATDGENRLYGEERLKTVLDRNQECCPAQLLPAVKEDIDEFVGQAPQFDDITMLCLKYLGTE